MSFENASLPVGRFILNYSKTGRSYRAMQAILNASRANNLVGVEDLGRSPNGVRAGKKRKVRLTYYGPDCDVAGSCTDSVCDPGTVTEPYQFELDIAECTASKVYQLEIEDVRKVDGALDFTDHAMQQVAAKLPALRKLLARQVLEKFIPTLGIQPDGNETRRISLANITTGAINPTGLFQIERTFADTGFLNPFILGGVEVDTYLRAQDIAGLAASGLNSGQLGDTNMYYDALVNETFNDGQEHIIAFDPSTIKFVSWNRNAGIFATEINSVTQANLSVREGVEGKWRGTLVDPVYGLAWDLEMYFSACGEYLNYQLKLQWDLWTLPDQACNIQGLNGRFHFTTCPQVMPTCPDGDPIPSLIVAATYSWTPGAAASGFINSLVVNGVATEPDVNVSNIAQLAAVLNANSGGQQFTVNGTALQYSGYAAITGTINGGTAEGGYNIVFATA